MGRPEGFGARSGFIFTFKVHAAFILTGCVGLRNVEAKGVGD